MFAPDDSKLKGGGPAFPKRPDDMRNGSAGMSLLEYYAGQALPAMAERALIFREESGDGTREELFAEIAEGCFEIAEAMIAERDRRQAGNAEAAL